MGRDESSVGNAQREGKPEEGLSGAGGSSLHRTQAIQGMLIVALKTDSATC